MSTPGRPARRLPRLAAVAAALTCLLLAAACGGSGSSSDGGKETTAAGGTPAATSTAIPTQDVVSSIAADPALKAELPAAIRDRGTITAGVVRSPGTSGLPHAGQTADGTTVGLDVDLREAVAKVLGVTWKQEYGTFASIIPGVQNGKYDVGQANFGVTAARLKVVDFASYLVDGQSFLGAKDLPLDSVTKLTDLCGLTVATTPGTTFQQILTDAAKQCPAAGRKPYTVQYFNDTAPIILGLGNGKVDVYFGPTLGLKYDAAHIAGTKFLGQISSTTVGFATAKGSPIAKALADAVNKLIASGDYARIFAKWGVTGTGVTTSQVNPAAAF
ncbi:ABC transporter substrate-binding protein [Actinacidiphila sp. ITFR-21]|uniref:ABC transporter substrate-binding protein n=1 Tax=Actinacidiphila sp. ITFR-21 TaxID=3075199 RepID=UPI00288B39A3|nr:ABC transporter substrate-binding protein [Streptomyces sp. ITFR-21]WNI14379.1 ABC transporter substrate-binding protein [Streptomyces sp. ITFR-21]